MQLLLPLPWAASDSPDPPAAPKRRFILVGLRATASSKSCFQSRRRGICGGPRGVEYHVEVTVADDQGRVMSRAGPGLGDGAAPHGQAVTELSALEFKLLART